MGCSNTKTVPLTASEHDKESELLSKRELTVQQSQANAEAAAQIAKVAVAMEQATNEEREPACRQNDGFSSVPSQALWDHLQGSIIDGALDHTPLVDLEYLVMLARRGGVMPCGLQHVPPSALITKANVWRLKLWNRQRYKAALGVLVFSYPWLDWFHPDRLGAQLRRLLPILEAMLAEAKRDSPYCTVGVMIDFQCLPQRPFADADEKARQRHSLHNVNVWYFHQYTYVLLVTTPPADGAEYGNTRLHQDRGWCHFEKAAAMVVKPGHLLLDVAAYEGATEFGAWQRQPNTCTGQMMTGRAPLVSPAVFGKTMRARVASGELKFTSSADMQLVIGQYEAGFVETLNSVAAEKEEAFRCLSWMDLGWGDAEAVMVLEALRYAATRCCFPHGAVMLCIQDGNRISPKMEAKFDNDKTLRDKFVYKRVKHDFHRMEMCRIRADRPPRRRHEVIEESSDDDLYDLPRYSYYENTSDYTASELRRAGFTASDIKKSGLWLKDLKEAFTLDELKAGGFTLEELQQHDVAAPS